MVFPKNGKFFCNKCNQEIESDGKSKNIKSEIEKNDVIVDGDSTAALPKTRVECPKCEYTEAYYYVRQNRAADEPETMFYTCCKCKYKWKY